MLTNFFYNLGFNVFASGWAQFACAFGTAFVIMMLAGRPFIRAMHAWQKKGQPISENVPAAHRRKAGTPTMGGILILVAVLVASVLFMPTNSRVGWIALLSLVMFGTIGFIDDYKKVSSQSKKASNGLKPSTRLIVEGLCVIVLATMINGFAPFIAGTMPEYVPSYSLALGPSIMLPFSDFFTWMVGDSSVMMSGAAISVAALLGIVLYYIFSYFVICGSANATNITDGLDGMLTKLYIPVLVVLVVALYGATRIGFMDTVLFLPTADGLYAPLGAMLGAMLGFLWYNARPASIFMGDVGSLALGGFMGTVAMLLKSEVIMGVAAGMMVLILLSSFIQTMYFKITRKTTGTGRRVFLRAPLHHHFEEKGWDETKIVDRFFVASVLFSGLALVLLKFA